MTGPMTDEQLAAIRGRSNRWMRTAVCDDMAALLAEVDRLRAQVAAVERLAEPFLDQPDGYQHYAVVLTDGVHFSVLVEDLRAALAAPDEVTP